MNKFDIINDIEEPNLQLLGNDSYFNRYVTLFKLAEAFRMELLRILNEHFLFYLLEEKEYLTIKYESNGKHKFDYSTINDEKLRNEIKIVLDDTLPIIF